MLTAAEILEQSALTAKLQHFAFIMWGWDTESMDDLGDDPKRFADACTVARLIDGGAVAVDQEIERGDDDYYNRPGFSDARLMSLYEFVISWRKNSVAGVLSGNVPPFPVGDKLSIGLLSESLTVAGMFASGANGWNTDGKYGTFDDDRYDTPGLPISCTLPKWTNRELCCLLSLVADDPVQTAAEEIAVMLSTDTETPYGKITRAMERENGTDREIVNAALKRLLESGAVVMTKDESRKLTTWRLEE